MDDIDEIFEQAQAAGIDESLRDYPREPQETGIMPGPEEKPQEPTSRRNKRWGKGALMASGSALSIGAMAATSTGKDELAGNLWKMSAPLDAAMMMSMMGINPFSESGTFGGFSSGGPNAGMGAKATHKVGKGVGKTMQGLGAVIPNKLGGGLLAAGGSKLAGAGALGLGVAGGAALGVGAAAVGGIAVAWYKAKKSSEEATEKAIKYKDAVLKIKTSAAEAVQNIAKADTKLGRALSKQTEEYVAAQDKFV